MRGADWTIRNDNDSVHKTCALLAGFALALCKDASSVRKADAFMGRVRLPFLETAPAAAGAACLALIECSNEWVAYTATEQGVVVHTRGEGLDGLKAAVVFVSNKV
jgi:hypothetical protein